MWGKVGPKENRNVKWGLERKKEIHGNHFRRVIHMEKARGRKKRNNVSSTACHLCQ